MVKKLFTDPLVLLYPKLRAIETYWKKVADYLHLPRIKLV